MENIFLSDEAYKILQEFSRSSPIPTSETKIFSKPCMDQLRKYEFIKDHTLSYKNVEGWSVPDRTECSITEGGRGYLAQRKHEESTLDIFKAMSESAKTQADLAIQAAEDAKFEAKRARRNARISIFIAALSVLATLLSPFLSEYVGPITKWLLKLF